MQEKKFDIKKLEKIPKEKCFICKNQINKEDIVFENNQKNNVPPHLKRCGLIGTCFLDAQSARKHFDIYHLSNKKTC